MQAVYNKMLVWARRKEAKSAHKNSEKISMGLLRIKSHYMHLIRAMAYIELLHRWKGNMYMLYMSSDVIRVRH